MSMPPNLVSTSAAPTFPITQVPVFRDTLLRQGNWSRIAGHQKDTVFSPDTISITEQQLHEMLRGFDFLTELDTPASSPKVTVNHELGDQHLGFLQFANCL